MTLVLDAGALLALERNDRRVESHLLDAHLSERRVLTSAAVAAQAWRDQTRQVNLVRALRGVAVHPLGDPTYRRVGELLTASGTADVADAHLALLVGVDDTVLTSDPDDLRRLLATRGVRANVLTV